MNKRVQSWHKKSAQEEKRSFSDRQVVVFAIKVKVAELGREGAG